MPPTALAASHRTSPFVPGSTAATRAQSRTRRAPSPSRARIALRSFLTGDGRDVWVDWEDIPPASEWEADIYSNIDAAESVVFVVSTSSLASKYCGAEFRHAQERLPPAPPET